MPVAKPARDTLLTLVTLSTPATSVTSPVCVMFDTLAVLAAIAFASEVLSIAVSTATQDGAAAPFDFNTVFDTPEDNIAVLLEDV